MGIDQLLIIWEIILSKDHVGCKAKVLSKINTKYFEDFALSSTQLVSTSKNQAYVYHFETKTEKKTFDLAFDEELVIDQEDYDDKDHTLTIETKDSITAICLSENGRDLLCNVSMSKPRIENWDIIKGICTKKYRGHD